MVEENKQHHHLFTACGVMREDVDFDAITCEGCKKMLSVWRFYKEAYELEKLA